jgi:hypothetical protein
MPGDQLSPQPVLALLGAKSTNRHTVAGTAENLPWVIENCGEVYRKKERGIEEGILYHCSQTPCRSD